MKKVYYIEGGFQAAQQEYALKGQITVKYGKHRHAKQCLKEGIGGQLFFTNLAWSESLDSIIMEAKAYTGCKRNEIIINS